MDIEILKKVIFGTINGTVNAPVNSTNVQKQKLFERQLSDTVEKAVEKILQFIKENPKITQNELAQKKDLTRRGVEWNIHNLKEKGILKRVGSKKDGYWVVL